MCMTTWVSIKFILLLLLLHANFLTATTRGKVSPFVIPTCIFNSSRLFKCSSIFSSSGPGFIQKATFSRETRSWNSPTANYNPVLSSLPFPLPRCRHLGEHTNTQKMIYRDTKENCYISLYYCVTRAPLLYYIRSWVALSFKCESVSESVRHVDTLPDLHFVQYIKAWMSSTDSVSSITSWYRLILTQYTASSSRNAQLSQLDLV